MEYRVQQETLLRSRTFLLSNIHGLLSFFYLLALAIGRFLLHLNSSSAALFALGSAFPTAPLFGPSVLGGLFGVSSSAIAITSASIVSLLLLVPISVVILESARIREHGARSSGTSSTKAGSHLPRYSEEQFLEVSVKVLPKLKIASVIGKAVWDQGGDIRDVISIGKLVRKNDGPEEVEQILATMSEYGEINNNHTDRTSGSDSEI
ncbi:MAG: hypothetical protein WBF33_00925 [Candidatus Nitrosopolaris sp.]|jgi:predicted permease